MGETTHFTVTLRGKERPLKFRSLDAVELKRRFNEPVQVVMKRRILGLDEANVPTNDRADIEAQVLLLTLCLNSGGWSVTEELVHGMVTEHVGVPGQSLFDLVGPAVRCAYMSGSVLGYRYDLVAETEKAAAELITQAETTPQDAGTKGVPAKGKGRKAPVAAP